MIDAFSGTLKKNKDIEDLKPYEVALSKELEQQVESVLKERNLQVVSVKVLNIFDALVP